MCSLLLMVLLSESICNNFALVTGDDERCFKKLKLDRSTDGLGGAGGFRQRWARWPWESRVPCRDKEVKNDVVKKLKYQSFWSRRSCSYFSESYINIFLKKFKVQ